MKLNKYTSFHPVYINFGGLHSSVQFCILYFLSFNITNRATSLIHNKSTLFRLRNDKNYHFLPLFSSEFYKYVYTIDQRSKSTIIPLNPNLRSPGLVMGEGELVECPRPLPGRNYSSTSTCWPPQIVFLPETIFRVIYVFLFARNYGLNFRYA